MSVPDLESRLRQLRIQEPPPDLGARILGTTRSMHRLGHQLRVAWSTAAAAALLVLDVGWTEPDRTPTLPPVPAWGIPEDLVETGMLPMRLAMAEPKADVWKAARRYADAVKGECP